MVAITCNLGSVGTTHGSLVDVPGGPELVAEYFFNGSAGDIQLVIDSAGLSTPALPGQESVQAYDLHRALEGLTDNSLLTGPANSIGVIYAGSYRPYPSALGVMFDRGGDPTFDDPNQPYASVPREGCAIFTSAIRALRGAGDDFLREILFTTIHELGHVFNLPHRASPVSFMAQSPEGAPLGDHALHFEPDHESILSRCSESLHVHPGGSAYGDLGPLANWAMGDTFNRPRNASGPKLRINLEPAEFLPFEPVELDIRLSLPRRAKGQFTVPDTIDPGYRTFQIWIEDPAGERRLYRSPRHYCGSSGRQTLTAKRSFQRDVSIFRESGRFTFWRAGEHRIWARFSIGRRGWIRSNTVRVSVLPLNPDSPDQRELRRMLIDDGLSQFLYHRQGSLSAKAFKRFEGFCIDGKGGLARSATAYTLGRVLLEGEDASVAKRDRRQRIDLGTRLLESALENGLPGRNRRRIAEVFLKDAALAD